MATQVIWAVERKQPSRKTGNCSPLSIPRSIWNETDNALS